MTGHRSAPGALFACALAALGLLACEEPPPPAEVPSWWEGPGSALAGQQLGDDDDSSGGGQSAQMFRPHAVVALAGDDGTSLVHVALWQEDADLEDFAEVPPQSRVVGAGAVIVVLSAGPDSSIMGGAFGPDWITNGVGLPPNSDPWEFVQGDACSLVVLRGSQQALILPNDGPGKPTFLSLSDYADSDGDAEFSSATRIGERFFLGLERTDSTGPSPEGGLAVETDCSGQVQAARGLGAGPQLVGARTDTSQAYVRTVGSEGNHDLLYFEPDADPSTGSVALGSGALGGDLGPATTTDHGHLWAVLDEGEEQALHCFDPMTGESSELDRYSSRAVAMEIDWKGNLSVVLWDEDAGSGELRVLETSGCSLEEPEARVFALDREPVDLAAVVVVVTGDD